MLDTNQLQHGGGVLCKTRIPTLAEIRSVHTETWTSLSKKSLHIAGQNPCIHIVLGQGGVSNPKTGQLVPNHSAYRALALALLWNTFLIF